MAMAISLNVARTNVVRAVHSAVEVTSPGIVFNCRKAQPAAIGV